ncbi:MAG: dTMP kinase [Legionellales bacterium]|nr:dTMP kinase [Legionellales bacterium]
MMTQPGFFITLEGIEGVGKSTAAQFIHQLLTEKKIVHLNTREPGGTPIAEAIRQVLLQDYPETMHADTELLLLFASRNQHLVSLIKPALLRGETVICDRFTDASYAYQGGGRGVDIARIAQLETWVQGELRPNLTLLFDADVDIALKRLQGKKDRIEQEKNEFFAAIRATYLLRAQQYPERYCIINANCSCEEVNRQILQALTPLFQW